MTKKPATINVTDDPEEKIVIAEGRKPQPIDLGDMAGLKRGLDDCALNVRCLSNSFAYHLSQIVDRFLLTRKKPHPWLST